MVTQPDQFPAYATPGQDIRVQEAWANYSGQGVTIAVVDDGVQYTHPDLYLNYNAAIDYDFNGTFPGNPDFDPLPDRSFDFHGTAVAGLAAGTGNNGVGISGVAYDAELTALRLIGGSPTSQDVFEALTHESQIIDVYNNSWAFQQAREIYPLIFLEAQAFVDSVFLGRGGLGTVQVFAAGNDGDAWDNSGFSGLAANRYSIAVGAVDQNGRLTDYTEGGTNILLVAPSSDGDSSILTTDLVGDDGYNAAGYLDDGGTRDFFADVNYTSTFGGTSAAAPLVSGVVALMLEANPNLSYRDVSEILARSARQESAGSPFWITNVDPLWIDPPVDASGAPDPFPDPGLEFFVPGVGDSRELPNPLIKNGAGNLVHDSTFSAYGHGVLDADLAVRMAELWNPRGPEAKLGTGLRIITNPDFIINAAEEVAPEMGGPFLVPGGWNAAGGGWNELYKIWLDGLPEGEDPPEEFPPNTRPGNREFFVQGGNLSLENVELTLKFDDAMLEDFDNLRITLVSPDGTHSDFNNYVVNGSIPDIIPINPEDGFDISYTFTTTRHLGERTDGNFAQESDFLPGLYEPQPWTLEFTNWGESDFHVGEYEISFYGTAVPPGRIQGSVGLDTSGDGDFNHTMLVDAETLKPIRDLVAEADKEWFAVPQQESWAAGSIVFVDLNLNGVRDGNDLYDVVGADGNYYFDVPFGTYRVVVEPPAGTVPLTPVSIDVTVGADDVTTPQLESRGLEQNFTLTPLDVVIQGNVIADLNGNGVQDFAEPFAHSRFVFIDLNGDNELDFQDLNFNLQFDFGIDVPLEPLAESDLDGSYELRLSPGDIGFSGTGFYTVILREQSGWTTTGPGDGIVSQFVTSGSPETLDFFAQPELASISGLVYNDLDGSGDRDGNEAGLPGFIVLLDSNDNGIFDAGELVSVTGSTGAYTFPELLPLRYTIRVLTEGEWEVTQPQINDGTYPILLDGGEVAVARDFGLAEIVMMVNADFNQDGMVDGGDFLLWQAGFGTTSGATNAMGDADFDGDVDGADFLLWQSAFGTGRRRGRSCRRCRRGLELFCDAGWFSGSTAD